MYDAIKINRMGSPCKAQKRDASLLALQWGRLFHALLEMGLSPVVELLTGVVGKTSLTKGT